jgi:hypothetical protein
MLSNQTNPEPFDPQRNKPNEIATTTKQNERKEKKGKERLIR